MWFTAQSNLISTDWLKDSFSGRKAAWATCSKSRCLSKPDGFSEFTIKFFFDSQLWLTQFVRLRISTFVLPSSTCLPIAETRLGRCRKDSSWRANYSGSWTQEKVRIQQQKTLFIGSCTSLRRYYRLGSMILLVSDYRIGSTKLVRIQYGTWSFDCSRTAWSLKFKLNFKASDLSHKLFGTVKLIKSECVN